MFLRFFGWLTCGEVICGSSVVSSDPIKQLVELRTVTHGDWVKAAVVLTDTLKAWQDSPNWERLSPSKRVALTLIAHKVSRILCGNSDFEDHWDDIQGFAKLGKRE